MRLVVANLSWVIEKNHNNLVGIFWYIYGLKRIFSLLFVGEYDISKDYGKKSLECAENIDDEVWQLNATVLIAQSDVKIGTSSSLNSAVENFEKALKMTEKQSNKIQI